MSEDASGLVLAGYIDAEGWVHGVEYHEEVSQRCGPNSCEPLYRLLRGYTTIRSDSWRRRSDFGIVAPTEEADDG